MQKKLNIVLCIISILCGCIRNQNNAKPDTPRNSNHKDKLISQLKTKPEKKIDSTLAFKCDYKYDDLKTIDILDEPFLGLSEYYFKKEYEIISIQEKAIDILKKKGFLCYNIYYSGICLNNLPETIKLVYGLSGDYVPNQVLLLSFQGDKLIDVFIASEYFGDADDYSSTISKFTGTGINIEKKHIDSKRTMTNPDTLKIIKAQYHSMIYKDGYFIEKLDSIKENFKEVKIWKARKRRTK
jgi:hypothetical protein